MEDNTEIKKTLHAEYEKLKRDREEWIYAGAEAAKYTIPSIAPDNDDLKFKNKTKKKLITPNQSVGADGVNNLAAKVTTTLLPPNQAFFRFKADKAYIRQLAEEQGLNPDDYEKDVNSGLANLETMLLDYMESFGDRICLGEALKHLYITGNVLLVFEPQKGLKYYPLSRYVIKRDYCGNVQTVITAEKIAFLELPVKFQDELLKKRLEQMTLDKDEDKCKLEEKEFILYTKFHRCKKNWVTWQEVDDIKLEGTQGKYPIDIAPFIALRYVRVDGESYGRGLIEDYFGDISYLDYLSLAIKESALAGSKLLMLVNPNSTTSIRELSRAKNGDFVKGNPNDVQALQANKYNDLQVAQATADRLEQRLNRIFCMKAAIQRDAERVTAEEIRQMAADLEEALGNHYALMAKEFQLAYVKITYYHLRKEKRNQLPDLLREKDIKLTITTGLEALSRTSDLNKLVTFFDVLTKLAQSAQIVGAKTDKLADLVAASLNLDVSGMFYTEEEKQAQAEAIQQSELANKVAPNIVNKGADMLMQQEQEEST